MPTPSEIILTVSGLMNDYLQQKYNNAACLPFFNLALDELQETYELNEIPVTYKTSSAITIPIGASNTTEIGHDTNPALPSNLIEIVDLSESTTGLGNWMPMTKVGYISNILKDNTPVSNFGIYAIKGDRIEVLTANQPNDIKINYIASIFNTPILIKDVNVNLPFTNIKTYLEYKTAALCAMFIAENESRATVLDGLAGTALSRALGIPIKGMQSIVTRRRPFRASYKHRGVG